MDVQTDEPSTRPKVHVFVDSDMQTEEEPSCSKTTAEDLSGGEEPLPKRSRLESSASASCSKSNRASNHLESECDFTPMAESDDDFQDNDTPPKQV